MKRTKRLLVVGPLPSLKHKIFGGTTVLMQNFYEYLDNNNFKFSFLRTQPFCNPKFAKINPLLNMLYLGLFFLPMLFRCDIVMFNFSNRGFITILPFLVSLSKFFHKKIVIRKFAGSMELFWNDLTNSKRMKIIDTCSHSSLIFFETKKAIDFYYSISHHSNIQWFPNVRKPYNQIISNTNKVPKKFVFISLVAKTKGIDEILSISKFLPTNYTIDIYGRLEQGDYDSSFTDALDNIFYKGCLENSQVLKTLFEYDMLLLPSYSEGYPGIVIEAFSIGMPVISTNVGGIPELVINGYNGKLIPRKTTRELLEAMVNITSDEYHYMCVNALTTFNNKFNSNFVNKNIIQKISSL